MIDKTGSTWRKWDLHVHSPASNGFTGSWDQFEEQLKKSEAEVIGINDYFSVEGYKNISKRISDGKLDLGQKKILPVVEFRMRDVLKNKHLKQSGVRINFHVIFSTDVDITAVETFIKSLNVNDSQIGSRYNDPDFLKNKSQVYFETDVLDKLKNNPDFKGRYLVWLPYDEYGGIDEIDPASDDWIKCGFINKSQLLGSSNQKQIEFLLWRSPLKKNGEPKFTQDQFKEWFGFTKGCIKGSDSHDYKYPIGKLRDEKSKPINKYCWIKGEPCFETLKQIVFDPEGRVCISENKPIEPTNVIEKISLSVPKDATISIEQKDGTYKKEPFCFAGHSGDYALSPYFNCFIGGRGTGKSTVLNFLGVNSKDKQSSQEFWKKMRPSFSAEDNNVFTFDGVKTFEFIGQSEVERFATNKDAFTTAIYKRANSLSDGKLLKIESELESCKSDLLNMKDLMLELRGLKEDSEILNEDKKTLSKSLKVTKSDEYRETTTEITIKSSQLNDLISWRESVEELKAAIEEFKTDESPDESTEENQGAEEPDYEILSDSYQKAYASAQKHIDLAIGDLDPDKFKENVKLETTLTKEISGLEDNLTTLLEKSGLSEENILQVKSAPQKIVGINEKIVKVQARIKEIEKELLRYDKAKLALESAKTKYEKAIVDAIHPLVSTLKSQALENRQEDIKEIGLEYYYDAKLAWEDIADSIVEEFSDRYEFEGRSDSLREYIVAKQKSFAGEHKEILACLAKDKGTSNYITFLRDVFSEAENYETYKALRDTHLNDAVSYKKIQVLYDGRDVESASFGQKCTAVIVILILFGNYPLIIDEPEAHLDSSLVANYLVPLIKKNKKNRQIIFATHNANFVVNGDAEKIFVLQNDGSSVEFLETVIEDTDNRSSLLKLEGGREAFKKRSDKLSIL